MTSTLCKTARSIGQFLQNPLLLVIRLYWGYLFVFAGAHKFLTLNGTSDFFHSLGIPLPLLSALLVGFFELVGGSLLIIGLWTRLISIPLLTIMLVALALDDHLAVMTLINKFDPTPLFKAAPFLFAYALAVIFCFGPGKISLDYWMGNDS